MGICISLIYYRECRTINSVPSYTMAECRSEGTSNEKCITFYREILQRTIRELQIAFPKDFTDSPSLESEPTPMMANGKDAGTEVRDMCNVLRSLT